MVKHIGIYFAKLMPVLIFTSVVFAQTTYNLNGQWQSAQINQIPRNAVVGGQDIDGRKLVICRASMGGGVHPGKIYDGMCNFGYGGDEKRVGTFEVLVGNSIERLWVSRSTGFASGSSAKPLSGATIAEGGSEQGQPLPICRAPVGGFGGGAPQPGKLKGDKCHIPFNHHELEIPLGLGVEVLYSTLTLPSPIAQIWVDINRGGPVFDVVQDVDIPQSNGSSLAVYTDKWIIFYSKSGWHGSELRIKGPLYLSDLRNFVKMNGPCISGATTLPPGDWNDEITSLQLITDPHWSPDSCGTNCPAGAANGYCGPPLPPPPLVQLETWRRHDR